MGSTKRNDGSEVTTASDGNGGDGKGTAGGAAQGGWVGKTGSIPSRTGGGMTGLGVGERDDGEDIRAARDYGSEGTRVVYW